MKSLNIKSKKAMAGRLFILPWFIGLIIFFIQPVILFFMFSFYDFNIMADGGYNLVKNEAGFFNQYIKAWTSDSTYPIAFVDAFKHFAYEVPIISFFSFFMAVLLNQDFKGRTVMRAIFFLPIIITSGVISIVISQGMSAVEMGTTTGDSLFDASLLAEYLVNYGIPQSIVNGLTMIVSNVAVLVWKSGVQILIFLIGLLSIPQSYYEAAKVEGSTGWETFWKITFPVTSPFILANVIYTFITSCMDTGNGVINYVLQTATENFNYSYSSAMLWMYFFAILLIIVLIFTLTRKAIFSSR